MALICSELALNRVSARHFQLFFYIVGHTNYTRGIKTFQTGRFFMARHTITRGTDRIIAHHIYIQQK